MMTFDTLKERLTEVSNKAMESNNGVADISAETGLEEEYSPLDECTDIPPRVYTLLPTMHRELCSLYNTNYERHVFLCGLLPTVAHILTNVRAAHADGFYSPDFFFALVAAAGQGKSTAARAFQLASVIDEELRQQSKTEMAAYQALQQAKEQVEIQPPPPMRRLFVPANSSQTVLIQTLYDNDGKAFFAETEIDSLLAAERNVDWGNVTTVLRLAFHHETIALMRKTPYRGETVLTITQPALSVFLSGTLEQFRQLMRSTENGLFSRFAFYFHNPPLVWRSHRATKQSCARADIIMHHAKNLAAVYRILKERIETRPESPVRVELTESQWDMIDNTFGTMQKEFYHEENRADLLSSVRRGAVIALRLAMQFAVIRWIDEFGVLGFGEICRCEESVIIPAQDNDVACAVLLARLFVGHAEKLSSLLPEQRHATINVKSSVMRFLEALPTPFSTQDALNKGNEMAITRATVFRYIKKALAAHHIESTQHGIYQKVCYERDF
jgi:hypothetical protein